MLSAPRSTPVRPRDPRGNTLPSLPSPTTRAVRRRMKRATHLGVGLSSVAASAALVASLLGVAPSSASPATPPTGTGLVLNAPVVAGAATPDGHGYWLVGADGGVFAFGDAGFYGSVGGLHLDSPVVGFDASRDGHGYWEVSADGGVFAFGDAGFHGSSAGLSLGAPVVGLASTSDGRGYWLVSSDGGVFAFGDATYHGSAVGMSPTSPIVGLAPTANRRGYWEVAADGAVYAFGDAAYAGTAPANSPVVGIEAAGHGYRIISRDGGTFAFGGAAFLGSLAGRPLNKPVVGTSSTAGGYLDVASDGGVFTFGSIGFYGSLQGSAVHTPPAPPLPAAVASPAAADYGLSAYQIAEWDRVNVCEEGGNWHVEGAVYAGGLGMSRANWSRFNTFGFPGDAAQASPLQQIRVAVAFATYYYGNPDAAPDQNGCTGGY